MPWAYATAAVGSALVADEARGEGQPAQAQDITPAAYRRLRNPVSDALQQFIDNGGGPQFSGQFTADMTDQERQLLSGIGQQVGQQSGATQAGQNLLESTIQGNYLSPDSNPFLAQSIEAAQRPVVQQFQDQTMPRLRSQFTQAGQKIQADPRDPGAGQSSPFDRAAAIATRGMTQELGDISSQMAAQNYQNERSRQMQAAQAAPQFDQAQLEQLVTGLEASALPRLIEQQGIDRGLQEFRRRTDTLLNAIKSAGALSAPEAVTFQGTQPQTSALDALAQSFSTGYAGQAGQNMANQ